MRPSPYEKIEHDRREKWRKFRERNGMDDDAPFSGKHPLIECYEEALDALNYLDEADRQVRRLPDRPDGVLIGIRIAAGHVKEAARFVLGAIEDLREQEAWEDVQ